MNAYEMYGRFLALQRHFTSDYDAFKYNFKVRTNHDKFMERNDRFMFHKLSKHDDPDGLMISNFLIRDKVWVTDLFDARAEETYKEYRKRRANVTYNFRNELSKVDVGFNEMLEVKNGQYPILLRKFLSKDISPETMVGVEALTGVFKMWDKNITDEYMWPETRRRLTKYRPFLELKKDALKQVVIDIFSVP